MFKVEKVIGCPVNAKSGHCEYYICDKEVTPVTYLYPDGTTHKNCGGTYGGGVDGWYTSRQAAQAVLNKYKCVASQKKHNFYVEHNSCGYYITDKDDLTYYLLNTGQVSHIGDGQGADRTWYFKSKKAAQEMLDKYNGASPQNTVKLVLELTQEEASYLKNKLFYNTTTYSSLCEKVQDVLKNL